MNANSLLPREYLSGKDVHDAKGKPLSLTATIAKLIPVTLGTDEAWALTFTGTDRKLKLNKINISTLIEMFGAETDEWPGKEIGLVGAMTEFQGKRVQAIRINVPVQPSEPLGRFDPDDVDIPA